MDANTLDPIVRMVELGRPIAITDDLVVTVTNGSKGRMRVAVERTVGCGVALMASRIGKSKRPGKPVIRRMD